MGSLSVFCIISVALISLDISPVFSDEEEMASCLFIDQWFSHARCEHPVEDLHCEMGLSLCKCGPNQVCSAKCVHNTETSGEVPCDYMCKSKAKITVEENNNERYNEGLQLGG
ncbi:hypothetical protein SNE40_013980 [Patella caerulea]|uniref:Uncharacterized protein n=1 Tax=Patella caerulea TaxID=87958 RepID=A0AAN8JH10_PATCE